jgi:hypothetical protein
MSETKATKLIAFRCDEGTERILDSQKNKSRFIKEAIAEKSDPSLFARLKPFLGHSMVSLDFGNGYLIRGYADEISDLAIAGKTVTKADFGQSPIKIWLK